MKSSEINGVKSADSDIVKIISGGGTLWESEESIIAYMNEAASKIVVYTRTGRRARMYDYNGPNWGDGTVDPFKFVENGRIDHTNLKYSIDGYLDINIQYSEITMLGLPRIDGYAHVIIATLIKKGTNIKIYKLFGSRWSRD